MERLDSDHHNAAVVAAVTSKPDDQGKSKEANKHTTKERLNGNPRERKEAVAGAIAGDDFEAVTGTTMGNCYLTNAFNQTASGEVGGLDDVKDRKGGEEQIRVMPMLPVHASGRKSG